MSKNKVKDLYKLTRKVLFHKQYFCVYCDMIEYNKNWLEKHIYNIHDEYGKIIKIFNCRQCNRNVFEDNILKHLAKHH